MDALTLPKVYALQIQWAKYPPVHILLRAFMGIKDDEATTYRPKGVPSPVAARPAPKSSMPAYMRKPTHG